MYIPEWTKDSGIRAWGDSGTREPHQP
jgi:hypothetical protein